MLFPFGLESMPGPGTGKDDWLFYANRALEPVYRPERVLRAFAAIAAVQPRARLVVANDGGQRPAMEALAAALDCPVGAFESGARVAFVGRLDEAAQQGWYARARWYLSLPASDSTSVSVLEAMGHGCIPILSDLPANRELVEHALFAPAVDRFVARLRELSR
jgi:glycosyltransferase involved in cell wall biosynthesis